MILVFMGMSFYPEGGWEDYKNGVTEEDAIRIMKENPYEYDWVQVVDTETNEVRRYGENNLAAERELYKAV